MALARLATPEAERGTEWTDRAAYLRGAVARAEKELDSYFKSEAPHLTHAKNAGNSNAMNNFVGVASEILRPEVA